MKKLFVLFGFMAFCLACQEKVDVEKEKAAIIEVLNGEGTAFIANDLEGVFALHIQDELATRYDGEKLYKGWAEIKSLYEYYVERNSQDTTYKNPANVKENIVLKVTGNTAWLICDNIWKYEVNDTLQEWGNIQIAFFEKSNGKWKFSMNAFVPLPPEEQTVE